MMHSLYCYGYTIMLFPDESPAAQELRGLIRQHLEGEIEKLKLSVAEQIQHSEDSLNKRLEAAEGGGKGGKAAGRGGKKK